jgi:hypothetical protein
MPTIENEALVLDLLEWISDRPRTYAETMDAWRTSCPRLTIWEDVVDLKLVSRPNRGGPGLTVAVTAAGKEFLATGRPAR